VHEVVLQQGEKTITLKKNESGKGWGIVERNGYPVSAKSVREIVFKLAQAELIEPKTRDPSRYGQLNLGDPTVKGTEAKLVKLADADGQPIAEVVVGKNKYAAFGAGRSGTYLRRPGKPQTWLANLDLKAPMDISDWVEPVFFKVPKEQIKSVVVSEAGQTVYKLAPAADGKGIFEVVDFGGGRKVKKSLRVDDLINGIWTLEMLDVRVRDEAKAAADMTAVITAQDGTQYKISMMRDGKENREPWLTVDVTIPDGVKDRAEAEKIAAATKGWSFRIADWRARQTFKSAGDVFEKVAAETPKPTPASAKPAEGGAAKP
jgi:hypothetical protein